LISIQLLKAHQYKTRIFFKTIFPNHSISLPATCLSAFLVHLIEEKQQKAFSILNKEQLFHSSACHVFNLCINNKALIISAISMCSKPAELF